MVATGDKLFRCSRCKEFKVESSFSNNRTRSTGKSDRCKPCAVQMTTDWQRKNPDKVAARNKRWKDAHPEHVLEYGSIQSRKRRAFLRENDPALLIAREQASTCRKRGIEPSRYAELLEQQGNACAICKQPNNQRSRRLAIDHDHNCCDRKSGCTKCVRGLLCCSCNTSLHKLEKTKGWMEAAMSYLEKHAKSF